MSPRPTNSEGNSSRLPRIGSKQSTYFPVAMLPSRTTSQETLASISAERRIGPVNRVSLSAIGTVTNSRSSATPIGVSAGSNPRLGVMISTPGICFGGCANLCPYANFPRKYNPAAERKHISEFRVSDLRLSRHFKHGLGARNQLSAPTARASW